MRRSSLLLLLVFLAPLWVRMTGWRLRHRHPDPTWLTTAGDQPAADSRERVWPGNPPKPVVRTIYTPSRATWRPDPAAQVDEVRAKLADEAREKEQPDAPLP